MSAKDIFIAKAITKHGYDKFDYKYVTFKKPDDEVFIKCNSCLVISYQTMEDHLEDEPCKTCKWRKICKDVFVEKAVKKHGGKYDYSKVVYKNKDTEVIIKCNRCNTSFYQLMYVHLRGDNGGCRNCIKSKADTKEIFVEKAVAKHGDKYDYTETIYKDSRTKLNIKCNGCDTVFEQTPSNHLFGNGGCRCYIAYPKKSQEQFIIDAKDKHKDAYDYSQVEYKGSVEKVTIKCNSCDTVFQQIPHNHLRGAGCCPSCHPYIVESPKTTEEFIEEAIEIHGDKYKYDKVVYKNAYTKVEIYCVACKDYFYQRPDNHVNKGHGCHKCSGSMKKTTKEFIEEAIKIHGTEKYNYSEVEYENADTKVNIYCNRCKDYFLQTPKLHLRSDCQKCTISDRCISKEEFLEKSILIHGDRYKYDKVEYKTSNDKVEIYCNKCKKYFEQRPYNHMKGCGCNMHYNKTENILHDFLLDTYFENTNIIREKRFSDLPNARFDFYLDKYDLIIELDGIQHFKQTSKWQAPEINQTRDTIRLLFS
jgi:hypothetical protein